MKEICGFKGKNGQFYEKEQDCVKADIKFEIRDVESKLNWFWEKVEDQIFRDYHYHQYDRQAIQKLIAQKVLKHSNDFLDIISRKKELEKTLDKLQKQYKKESLPWWLKTIWWK